MFQANIVQGQGFQEFTIWKPAGGVSDTGRAVKNAYQPTAETFYGMLTNASQREIEQWKQNGHPISHKVISYSGTEKANATDYIVLGDGRQFYVQGLKNPLDLSITMIYYAEERFDIKMEGENNA